jgi:subtilisin family serine protease
MRPTPILLSCAVSTFLAATPARAAEMAAAAPRADARLLRALEGGADSFQILLGLRDGTPSARALRFSPDREGEPARRLVRLEAQKRLADEMPAEEFRVRHFYGSFSLLSATVTRAALLSLANRPDVDWIKLDGKKHPLDSVASNAQSLIHSDQANALGATGAGQAIAIVDTGVDYNVDAMGAGGFPNSKVVGGTDTANDDDDPMDCDGHGTSVASIAASTAGVAPSAKIVAVKVFSSTEAMNDSCADTADDSNILAGIDWAIDHRAQFNIGVINLSLGGAFEDTLDHGYCDADVPDYAAAFDSAIAAGMAVVVASGNDGTSNALSAPACASSAVSVGAVYSQTSSSQTWLDDMGATQCVDAPTAPDQIVCFSDSASNLSMLAPGAFWVVAKKGSGVNLFAGTSAAAPAVSGTVALLRQLRPALPPESLVGILRSTGKALTDPRNQVTTPRVDAFAAVTQDPTRFFAATPASLPVAIPDGSGSGSSSVTVSGLGNVSDLRVVVEIDHPDPQQLRVSLRGPDGTSILLRDQTGQHEHPINAVYGLTEVPLDPLSTFAGKPGSGAWTLTVEDRVADIPSSSGRIVSYAISITGSTVSTRTVGGRAANPHHTRVIRERSARAGTSSASEASSDSVETPPDARASSPDSPDRGRPIPQR